MKNLDFTCEWLSANSRGSFAMGCVDRIPRRKYHGLLTVREPGTGEPLNTLLDVGEYIEMGDKLYLLSSFEFENRVEPKGFQHLEDFSFRPVPKWVYQVEQLRIERTVEIDASRDIVRIFYRFSAPSWPSGRAIKVRLKPYILFRPWHHLTQQNAFLNGGVFEHKGTCFFQFYEGMPKFEMRVTGIRSHCFLEGHWVKQMIHRTEEERGYPAIEDAFRPGFFEFSLQGNAEVVFEAGVDALPAEVPPPTKMVDPTSLISRLEWAAEQYLLTTKKGMHSLIAGYPWFGHWGRDTFISMIGLCLDSGNESDAKRAAEILQSYGPLVVEGLLRKGIVCDFPEQGLIMTGIDTPLLYIRAVQAVRERWPNAAAEFMPTVCAILDALRKCPDPRVQVKDGGLFVQPGPWAVTWMDVLMDGQGVTPRTGFAVDINALFYNAMGFALEWARKHNSDFVKVWEPIFEMAEGAFVQRFWDPSHGYLADSHDGNRPDFSLRPNQLWALALPFSPVSRAMGQGILKAVRRDLVTPVGLRTLSPADSRYQGHYRGGTRERDMAYHQGTVWPWLIGIFGDAVFRVDGAAKMKEEMTPIVARLAKHMDFEGCLGQIAEVFDGEAPHAAGGTPAQAWSVAEVLRMARRIKS